MTENQERRQAHRQKRGAMRVEEILAAAGALFAELGYDRVTTNMIAARAAISPGSLYQFFPHKEAIAQAFAADAVAHLRQLYDTMDSPETMILPLEAFLGSLIDKLIILNRAYPGYLALELASTISPSLTLVLSNLQLEIQTRFDAMMAAYWPQSTPEQRRLPLLISYRLFLTLLPLILQSSEPDSNTLVQELKIVLYRYWKPIISNQKTSF